MHTPTLNAAALALAAILPLPAIADGKDLAPQDVPAAVRQAFGKAYPAAHDIEYEKKAKAGQTVYEVEFKDAGRKREATYGTDGALIKLEEAVKPEELPASVLDAVKQAHPRAAIEEAERTLNPDGTVAGYEVEIAEGREETEIEFDATGALLKTEPEKD